MTDKVAVRIFLRLEAPPVKENRGTFLLGTCDELLDPLLALRADDGTEIRTFFEATIDIEFLGPLGNLREPVLCLADHYQRTQGHAPLAGSTKCSTCDGVEGVVLVAVGQHSCVVLCSKVGLDTLAVGGATGVDVFASLVTSDETYGFDGRLVDDEIDCFGGAMDNIDDSVREPCLLGKLCENHCCTGVTFGRLED